MSDLPSMRSEASRIVSALPAGSTLAVFLATIFTSAFLLFAIQPMFTKMVTPTLGGTPAVWSVAMVFFQAVLLAGYAYAHALNRWLTPRAAAVVHVSVLAIAAGAGLPIAFEATWGSPPESGAAFWLIGVFAVSVGLPFFALSANGPLLQAWFARSGHPQGHDPYFLYGASNLGSFLALIGYPFVIEPALALKTQSAAWSAGFAGLLVAIATLALIMRRTVGAAPRTSGRAAVIDAPPVGLTDRLIWILYSFVPSALLVAVTAHVSTDVAAVPLLWVLPLALFLLTFVIAFSAPGAARHARNVANMPLLLALLLVSQAKLFPLPLVLAVHLGFFFVAVMVCHGEVYRRRPHASRLTEFYFFLSLGGVLGGVFASLVAPSVFDRVLEYPLMIAATTLLLPGLGRELRGFGVTRAATLLGGGLVAAIGAHVVLPDTVLMSIALVVVFASAGGMILARHAPLAVAGLAIAGLGAIEAARSTSDVLLRTRSFFAVHTVEESRDGRARLLSHGTTIHGAEHYRDATGKILTARPEPASYFYRGGPFSEAIEAVRQARGGRLGRVAVIGLGMGSLACHAREGEGWEFFEIDPVVLEIARDRRLFRSFAACAGKAPVTIGDGRLTLAASPAGYDLVILDVFSSDAVPVHLLTTEALATYAGKLTAGGALVFNITNRHMALDHVVAGAARANGFVTFSREDDPRNARLADLRAAAHVAIAARREDDIRAIVQNAGWRRIEPPPGFRPWRDDYSNIIGPMLRRHWR